MAGRWRERENARFAVGMGHGHGRFSGVMEAIFTAIIEDERARVRELLKADPGAATRSVDRAWLCQKRIFHWIYEGDTALHLAAAGYRVEIAQLLVAAGADPNARGNHRRSGPLHYAADGFLQGPEWNAARQVRTIECLLDAGADLHGQDKNGATALHRAVRTRCAAAVACLLKRGGEGRMKNKAGSTPFHLAVQNTGRGGSGAEAARAGQREIIGLFLAAGLKATLKDGKGKTVMDWARSDWIREMLSGNGEGDVRKWGQKNKTEMLVDRIIKGHMGITGRGDSEGQNHGRRWVSWMVWGG